MSKAAFSSFLRLCIPPIIFPFLRSLVYGKESSIYFEGSFKTYHDALAYCSGYNDKVILDRVVSATLSVLAGDAIAERDGVQLNEPCYSLSVLSGLLIALSRNVGSLSVIDYGGSLGSSFFQHKHLIQFANSLKWSIVEQSHFVSAGRDIINVENLYFFETIDDCASSGHSDVCLLSGVLQCIPDPFEILEKLISLKPDVIILDRVPYLNAGDIGYYAIQHVPPSIYPASYPSRFFVKDELSVPICSAGYSLILEFPSVDDLASCARWLGQVFVRNHRRI